MPIGSSLAPRKSPGSRVRSSGAGSWPKAESKGRAGWLASPPSQAPVRTQRPRPPSSPSSPRPIRPEISASQNFPLGNSGLPCRDAPGQRWPRTPAEMLPSTPAGRPGGGRAAQPACATQRRLPPLARAQASPPPPARRPLPHSSAARPLG